MGMDDAAALERRVCVERSERNATKSKMLTIESKLHLEGNLGMDIRTPEVYFEETVDWHKHDNTI